MFSRSFACLAAAATLSACSPSPSQGSRSDAGRDVAGSEQGEAKAAGAIEHDVRVQRLEQRVADLEREVGELNANPQKLDLDLISQRLSAVEAKAYADAPAAPPTARSAPTAKAEPRSPAAAPPSRTATPAGGAAENSDAQAQKALRLLFENSRDRQPPTPAH